jgi:hypothetical protein
MCELWALVSGLEGPVCGPLWYCFLHVGVCVLCGREERKRSCSVQVFMSSVGMVGVDGSPTGVLPLLPSGRQLWGPVVIGAV